jgi:RNA polymerase sigma-70 factor (family 1)
MVPLTSYPWRPMSAPLSLDRVPDDESWIRRIQLGDEAAYEAMFRAYATHLCAFAFRMVGSREVAEELVHDVFLSIWTRRTTWGPGSVRGYLFRAVQNRASNAMRHARVERAFVDHQQSLGEGPVAPAADRTVIEQEMREVLDAAVAKLPPRMRAVFVLRYSERLTFAEIGERLGVAAKTAENHMGRAVALLRAALPDLRQVGLDE